MLYSVRLWRCDNPNARRSVHIGYCMIHVLFSRQNWGTHLNDASGECAARAAHQRLVEIWVLSHFRTLSTLLDV